MPDTNRQAAKWASARARRAVSFFLLTEMSTTKCVSVKQSLDCQQMKIYCVSITRWLFLGQDTQNPGEIHCCPHPTLLFAQETAQDLILISLAASNNILGGLEIVVIDQCSKTDRFQLFMILQNVSHYVKICESCQTWGGGMNARLLRKFRPCSSSTPGR